MSGRRQESRYRVGGSLWKGLAVARPPRTAGSTALKAARPDGSPLTKPSLGARRRVRRRRRKAARGR